MILQFGNAFGKALLPIGNLDIVGLLELGLVEHGIVRTMCRRGEFCRMEGTNMARRDACQPMDGLGEVVPGDDTLVGEMIDSRLDTFLNGDHDDTSQVAGIGRCANLVEDDTQLRFLLA